MKALCIGLVTLIGLAAPGAFAADGWSRTLTLRIAVDRDFRQRPDWQAELRRSVDGVSAAWVREFGIRWSIADFVPWEPPSGDRYLVTGDLIEHLQSAVPSSNVDVVLGIYDRKCLDHFAGMSDYFRSSALVVTGCLHKPGARHSLETVLSHELAHLFGAFHVPPQVRSVMSGDAPDAFDAQTSRIIRLMRDRDFAPGETATRDLAARAEAISGIFAEGHRHGTRNPVATAYLVSGEYLLKRQRYEEALDAFRQASTIDSRWHMPHTGMGVAHERLHRPELAVAAFNAALAIDPADLQANAFLGRLKVAQGDAKGALVHFAAAVKADPGSAPLRTNLGLAYLGAGRAPEAEREFRVALRRDPDFPDGRSNLAASLGMQGKFKAAVRVLRDAIRRDPKDGKAYANLGYTLDRMGDARGAVEAYRKALALDPSNTRNRANLDRLLRRSDGEIRPAKP